MPIEALAAFIPKINKKAVFIGWNWCMRMVAEPGFEPGQTDPESVDKARQYWLSANMVAYGCLSLTTYLPSRIVSDSWKHKLASEGRGSP